MDNNEGEKSDRPSVKTQSQKISFSPKIKVKYSLFETGL